MGASCLPAKITRKTLTFMQSTFTQVRLSGYAFHFQFGHTPKDTDSGQYLGYLLIKSTI